MYEISEIKISNMINENKNMLIFVYSLQSMIILFLYFFPYFIILYLKWISFITVLFIFSAFLPFLISSYLISFHPILSHFLFAQNTAFKVVYGPDSLKVAESMQVQLLSHLHTYVCMYVCKHLCIYLFCYWNCFTFSTSCIHNSFFLSYF